MADDQQDEHKHSAKNQNGGDQGLKQQKAQLQSISDRMRLIKEIAAFVALPRFARDAFKNHKASLCSCFCPIETRHAADGKRFFKCLG
jgi:hypothetical protein